MFAFDIKTVARLIQLPELVSFTDVKNLLMEDHFVLNVLIKFQSHITTAVSICARCDHLTQPLGAIWRNQLASSVMKKLRTTKIGQFYVPSSYVCVSYVLSSKPYNCR